MLFTIPYECTPTGTLARNIDCYWELVVRAETPGIDYNVTFHVPVYMTAESSESVGSEVEQLPEEERLALTGTIRAVDGMKLR